jgi:CarD family transcriptional regulator
MRKGDNMFQIGDKAVYPGHGVGIIEAIQSMQISGKQEIFYVLRILDNGMTIMIPRENVGAVRLREVIRKIDVTKVIHILKESIWKKSIQGRSMKSRRCSGISIF